MRASQPRADGYVERHGVKRAPFEILVKNVNALGDPLPATLWVPETLHTARDMQLVYTRSRA